MRVKRKARIVFEGKPYEVEISLENVQQNPVLMEVFLNGKTYKVVVSRGEISPDTHSLLTPAKTMVVEEKKVEASKPPTLKVSEEKPRREALRGFVVESPLPGKIVNVKVSPGERVNAGDPLLVIDSMKMENVIPSPKTGVILEVKVSVGQSVQTGTPLIVISDE
ncbi:MAG: biotin/lipoyl-containing protein [Candidatus Bathyarchaeota archaeon]